MRMKVVSAKIKASKFKNVLNSDDETNIRVYGTELMNYGIVGDLEIKVIFPGYRKVQFLSGFKINDTYYARPLHGYNGEDTLSLDEYNNIVESAQVIPCDIFKDVREEELTDNVIKALKENYKLHIVQTKRAEI